jgi:four helix bundle protein
MRQYSFEKLKVWQESRVLVKKIYQISQGFPTEERFGLTAQIRSAAISIPSNIAEGAGRKYVKEQKQFYSIAYASLMEVLNQLILATDLDFLPKEILDKELRPIVESVSLKLYKLKS